MYGPGGGGSGAPLRAPVRGVGLPFRGGSARKKGGTAMKTQLAVSLGFFLALGATAPLAQQPSPPLSAPLLRRLAEAADGYRTGKAIYVVTSVRDPYDVRGVFATDSLATIEARKEGPTYRVYSPSATPRHGFKAAP